MCGRDSKSEAPATVKATWERLPSHIYTPKHYDLYLEPNLKEWTFDGNVTIHLDVKQPTRTIKLNTLDLTISKVEAVSSSSTLTATDINIDNTEEVSTFTFGEDVQVGDVELRIVFAGCLNDKMKGFYRSSYKTADGEEHRIACTQFEATDCRRAFPSFDEPALKSTFTTTIVAESRYQVISNSPCNQSIDMNNGYTKHIFDKTIVMSTYLVAFVVGEFDVLEDKTVNGTIVRVFTPLGKRDLGKFGLEVGVKSLPFYEQFFQIPYPVSKLDMLAIPDFQAGAMENVACVTYREVALLLDPINSSVQAKEYVALVVAHELAHQWFGNCVTMEWWTNLWLNEGFATWIEYLAVDHIFPEWKIWEEYVFSDFNRALGLDSLKNSHPIEVEVNHPSEVDEIFDIISYSKGSVVIRMLANYLGPQHFQQGLAHYLDKFKWRNAVTTDLWDALAEVSGKPVQQMMESWTKYTGYPLVEIDEGRIEGNQMIFEAKQTRFLQTGIDTTDTTTWHVPISFVIDGIDGPISKQIFSTATGKLILDLPIDTNTNQIRIPKYIKINSNQSGMYRVKYPKKLLLQLADGIRTSTHTQTQTSSSSLTATDRLGIQNECFALCRAGLLSINDLLDVIQSYEYEYDYNVWQDLLTNLNEIYSLIKFDIKSVQQFNIFMIRLLTNVYKYVGWEAKPDEPHSLPLLRAKIIASMGKYGNQETIAEAARRFNKFMSYYTTGDQDKAKDYLPADLRSATYAMISANGGIVGYEALLHIHDAATLQEEKVRCLACLGSTKDETLLKRTIEFSMDTSKVRSQDAPSVLLNATQSAKGVELGWEYLQANWSVFVERFGGMFSISRVVQVPAGFVSEQKAQEVEDFFKTHEAPAAERTVKQVVEKIRSNAQWLNRDKVALSAWLDNYVSNLSK